MSASAPASHDLSSLRVDQLTMALHGLHGRLDPGQVVEVALPDIRDQGLLLDGAGFVGEAQAPAHTGTRPLHLTRLRTLPDAVGTGLQVLAVGLNPSLTAADLRYGFASPSNRFWKAAVASGLVSVARDPGRSVEADRVGFTDLVKRATPKAADLKRSEFVDGRRRLEWTIGVHEPAIVCVMGVTGWRKAYNRDANLGLQPDLLAGSAVYVMPNPSGLNAHTNHNDLVEHFAEVLYLASNR